MQSVAVDPLERLWCLDTGRPLLSNGTLLEASFGGPKLVAINTTSDTVADTIVLPSNVAYGDSYLNDVRIDLRANLTGSTGQGVAYITDSSPEGRNGLIIVDIGSKTAWRHLDGTEFVRATQGHFKQVWGDPVYYLPNGPNQPYSYDPTGADGLGFTDFGDTLFWTNTGSRYLYSIPTSALRDQGPSSEVLAQASVTNHGQKGCSDGLMQDTNNYIYASSFEDNAINVYNPKNGSVSTYVRDPRIGWTDSMWVSSDNYLYFTENQLWRSPGYWPGTDRRVKPFALFRVPTADNGTRVAPS